MLGTVGSLALDRRGMAVHRSAYAGISKVEELGGDGGVIALDAHVKLALPFNTEGMYRGYVMRDGEIPTRIYGGE